MIRDHMTPQDLVTSAERKAKIELAAYVNERTKVGGFIPEEGTVGRIWWDKAFIDGYIAANLQGKMEQRVKYPHTL